MLSVSSSDACMSSFWLSRRDLNSSSLVGILLYNKRGVSWYFLRPLCVTNGIRNNFLKLDLPFYLWPKVFSSFHVTEYYMFVNLLTPAIRILIYVPRSPQYIIDYNMVWLAHLTPEKWLVKYRSNLFWRSSDNPSTGLVLDCIQKSIAVNERMHSWYSWIYKIDALIQLHLFILSKVDFVSLT